MLADRSGLRFEDLIAVDGEHFSVAAACQPLVAARSGEAAGWRFAPRVTGEDGPLALSTLDWRDAQQADLVVIGQAAETLADPATGPGPGVIVVSFSTLSSGSGRRALSERLGEASSACGRPLAIEMRELDGVPPARLAEVVSLIRPACAGVIAEVGPHRAEIAAIGHCGLAGVMIRTQGDWSGDPAQLARFEALTALARGSVARCFGRAPRDDIPILAAAGFTHVAVTA